MNLSPHELARGLQSIPTRAAQVVGHALLDDAASIEVNASKYGIDETRFCRLLARSLDHLLSSVGSTSVPGEHDNDAVAATLSEFLRTWNTADVSPPLQVARALRTHRLEIRAALEEAHTSPEAIRQARRETVARRILIAILLAVTAWLYANRPAEISRPTFIPRSLNAPPP